MPPNGGIVLPENVHVKPFLSKGNLNSRLNVGVLDGVVRSNGFPGGHADLKGGHPSLMKNFFERVLVTEVPSAPLEPEVIEKKATNNVKRLPRVSEAAGVISKEPGRVVLSLGGSLPE
jgi:hypothetical protein